MLAEMSDSARIAIRFLMVSKGRGFRFLRGAGRSFPMDRSAAFKSATIIRTPWKVVLGIEVEAEASGVGGNLKFTGPSTSGDISTKVNLYGAFRARFGYAFDRLLVLDNVLVYIALGGAFGSFSDHMGTEVGPAFIGFNQSTTRIQISKAVGSLGIGAAHPITPNLSLFVDYRYTALGPEWAHGRQIDVRLPDGVTAGSFGTRAMYHLVRVGANWKFDLGI